MEKIKGGKQIAFSEEKITSSEGKDSSGERKDSLSSEGKDSLSTASGPLGPDKLAISQWAEDDKPREKLMTLGADSLSNAELLAILIGSGSRKESAVDLMKRLLGDCENNLNAVGRKSISELMRYHGIGEAKAITILAACELGKRREHEEHLKRKDLGSPDAIYHHLLPRVRDLDVEEAYIVLMNQNFKHLKTHCLSHGGITETAVDVRVIIREALQVNATIVALAHNHPSGNLKPSKQDDQLTRQVQEACKVMRLHFLDHIIVTDGGYYSYRDEGRL